MNALGLSYFFHQSITVAQYRINGAPVFMTFYPSNVNCQFT